MATRPFVDSKNLRTYELALDRLEGTKSSTRQRPIVERGMPVCSREDPLSAAAKALSALWNKSNTGRNGGSR
jgi:hypothetical protein